MLKLTSPDNLIDYANKLVASRDPDKPCVMVCGGTGCRANHGIKVMFLFWRKRMAFEQIKTFDIGKQRSVVRSSGRRQHSHDRKFDMFIAC